MIWIDLVSLLDIWAKIKDTKKALEIMLQIICTVMAICNPSQSDLKKPLALPGRPSVTSDANQQQSNNKRYICQNGNDTLVEREF